MGRDKIQATCVDAAMKERVDMKLAADNFIITMDYVANEKDAMTFRSIRARNPNHPLLGNILFGNVARHV